MSVFPFFENVEEKREELPLFAEYAYDFDENKFLLDDSGKEYLVFKNDALKIWITKVLLTDRYKFLAYDSNYGSEIYRLIGSVKDIDILRLEVKRYIIESLMVNPYILEIDNFSIFEDDEKKVVSFYVRTIYSEFKFESEMEGVYG